MRYFTALGIAIAPVALLVSALTYDEWQDKLRGDSRGQNLAAFCDVSRWAERIEAYLARNGELPSTLEATHDSFAEPEMRESWSASLFDPWGRRYRYERTSSPAGFRVFTLGRDNALGGDNLFDMDVAAP